MQLDFFSSPVGSLPVGVRACFEVARGAFRRQMAIEPEA